MTLEERVKDYVLKDRQWPRWLRIDHAQFQLKQAKTDEMKQFWNAVLKRNRD